jgi:hypothetical protein
MIKMEFGIKIAEFGIFISIRHPAFNIPHFIDTLPFNPRTLGLYILTAIPLAERYSFTSGMRYSR